MQGQFFNLCFILFANKRTCIDLGNVFRMCREILNSCVRNTEEAERLSKVSEGSSIQSGRGLRKGVWGMIEESELAKSIRKGEEKRVCSKCLYL